MRISDWSSDVCSSDLSATIHNFLDPCRRPDHKPACGHYPRDFPERYNFHRPNVTNAPTFAGRRLPRPMSVAVFAFGLNHTSAPVSVRERVSMPVDLVRPALAGLRSAFGGSVRDAAILSTWNRTEVYFSPGDIGHASRRGIVCRTG